MAAFSIVDGQIVIKSFQEIRDEIRADWKSTYNSIDLSPTTVDGHHVDLEARTVSEVVQGLQSALTNLDRRYAQGSFLDTLAAFMGLKRLQSAAARPTIVFSGKSGTVIPQGTIVTFKSSLFDFSTDDGITIDNDGTASVTCTCIDYVGKVAIYVGDWILVNNTPQGVTCKCETQAGSGRNAETDAELRVRMNEAEGAGGLATCDSMITYLRNKISTSVNVNVNSEDVTVNSLPPHSFCVSVPNGEGLSADEIAQAIYECKPAGIRSSGNNSGTAISSVTGHSYTEYFSVPVQKPFYALITISEFDEETFPSDGVSQIKAAIVEWSKSEFVAGKDVVASHMFVPILSVQGILTVSVVVSFSPTNWKTVSIPVAPEEIATITENRITVRVTNG